MISPPITTADLSWVNILYVGGWNCHPPIEGSSDEEGAKTGKLRKKPNSGNLILELSSILLIHASEERKFNNILM